MEANISSWSSQMHAKVGTFFGELPVYAADILIFGPIGIFIGFLAKTLGRYLLIGLLLAILFFWIGDCLHVVTFHREHLQTFFGGHQINSIHDVGLLFMIVMRGHLAAVFAAIIGFLLGWKLGS